MNTALAIGWIAVATLNILRAAGPVPARRRTLSAILATIQFVAAAAFLSRIS